MNQQDINRIFTEQVNSLIAQGYLINLDTMRGSQGEIGKVDLRKGDEILRVVLRQESDYGECYNDYFVITIGRSADRHYGGWDNIIWDHNLEVISQIRFARITDDYFVTPEEGMAAKERRHVHRVQNRSLPRCVMLGEAFKSPALRWLRKQPRMKSCKLEEIESVCRIHCSNWSRTKPDLYGYEIKARGKTFMIKAPHAER